MDKKRIIIIGVVIAVLIFASVLILKNKGSQTKSEADTSITEELIPTVDASVQVSLTPKSGKKEVTLAIKGIPKGTQSIEYSLSYDTKKQSMQGVIGTVSLEGEKEYSKDITLGTCSSGRCVYHEVVGKIKLSLRFMGDYGERIFEKDYGL